MNKKAVLFLKGYPPEKFPNINEQDFVICTDGAYEYVKNENIKIDCVLGDFDSVDENQVKAESLVYAPDQNYTDFQKALEYLAKNQFQKVAVYGSAGKQEDHFLGNLSAAVSFKDELDIVFHETEYYFFLASYQTEIEMQIGKIVSLYPYPHAHKITTSGLEFPLHNEDLDMEKRIGIRNKSTDTTVKISFKKGNLWVFVYY